MGIGTRKNRYHLFGGRDESSASLIQGITLAGVLLDEVALMPRSFVEQAIARCSVEQSKFWFKCNPEHPHHWFYTQWIQKQSEKNLLYLHLTMEDNPSLSRAVKNRYQSLYSGSFYKRYVLGEWVAPQGLVYPMFSTKKHVVNQTPTCTRFIVSCDYGTVNPCSFGLWGEYNGTWYRLKEYYYHSRLTGIQKTDEEYCDALEQLVGSKNIEAIIVDPSAASFLESLRRREKFVVIPAQNKVASGIAQVCQMLQQNHIQIHESCHDCIREFSLYQWEENAQKDIPKKENDHAMDDIRYFVNYINQTPNHLFFASSVSRT